jgi:hypothetical protein
MKSEAMHIPESGQHRDNRPDSAALARQVIRFGSASSSTGSAACVA